MTARRHGLLRLVCEDGRHILKPLGDDELADQLRAELRLWLAKDPAPIPPDVRADIAAFVGDGDEPAVRPDNGERAP